MSGSVEADTAAAEGAPLRIAVVPDDYHTEWTGIAADGRLFFVTTPFHFSVADQSRREFHALYLWEKNGAFSEAIIVELDPAESGARNSLSQFIREHLGPKDQLRFERINVAPFEVESFGLTFGFIYSEYEGSQWVKVLPGDYIAFFPPWNGDYDT